MLRFLNTPMLLSFNGSEQSDPFFAAKVRFGLRTQSLVLVLLLLARRQRSECRRCRLMH